MVTSLVKNKMLVPVSVILDNTNTTPYNKYNNFKYHEYKSKSRTKIKNKKHSYPKNDFWDYKKNRHGKNWINPLENIRTSSSSSSSSVKSLDSTNSLNQKFNLINQWCQLFIERNSKVSNKKVNKKLYIVDLEKLLKSIFGNNIIESQRVIDRVYIMKIVMECLKIVGRRDDNPFFVLIESRKFSNIVQLSEIVEKHSIQYLENLSHKFEVSKDRDYGNVIKITCPDDSILLVFDIIESELSRSNKIEITIKNLNIEQNLHNTQKI